MWLLLAISALFTAFYMFRLYYLTFDGNERFDHKHVHPHESPATMTIVLSILAVLSALGGFLNLPPALMPWSHSEPLLKAWLKPVFEDANIILGHRSHHGIEPMMYVLMIVATAIALLMWYVAKKWYSDPKWTNPRKLVTSFRPVYNLLLNKYRLDEIYNMLIISPIKRMSVSFLWKVTDIGIIDGIVNGTAKLVYQSGDKLKLIQTGIAQNYAIIMVAGIIIVLAWLLVP